MKLYEISSELTALHDAIEDTESTSEELVKRLDNLNMAFETKVESICRFIRTLEGEEKVIDEEVKRLKTKSDQREKLVARLKQYISSNMEAVGMDKIKGQIFSVASYDSKPAVNVKNLSDVPNEFMVTYVEQRVDKEAVMEYFKATGEIPPGIEITQKKSLRIT